MEYLIFANIFRKFKYVVGANLNVLPNKLNFCCGNYTGKYDNSCFDVVNTLQISYEIALKSLVFYTH